MDFDRIQTRSSADDLHSKRDIASQIESGENIKSDFVK